MDIYDTLANILARVLSFTEYTLSLWVNVPTNATGPLDPNITLTTSGTGLVETIARLAVSLGNALSSAVQNLF